VVYEVAERLSNKPLSSPFRADGLALLRPIIPRQQLFNLALLMAVYDDGKRGGQISLGIDGIQFAGLNQ